MESVDLKTGGMHCGSCAMLIEMAVGELPGVSAVKVDRVRESTHVEFDPEAVSADRIIAVIEEAGYTASPAHA